MLGLKPYIGGRRVLLVVGVALFAQLRLRWSVLQVIGAAALVGALLTGLARLTG